MRVVVGDQDVDGACSAIVKRKHSLDRRVSDCRPDTAAAASRVTTRRASSHGHGETSCFGQGRAQETSSDKPGFEHDVAACEIAVDRREGGRPELAQIPDVEATPWPLISSEWSTL